MTKKIKLTIKRKDRSHETKNPCKPQKIQSILHINIFVRPLFYLNSFSFHFDSFYSAFYMWTFCKLQFVIDSQTISKRMKKKKKFERFLFIFELHLIYWNEYWLQIGFLLVFFCVCSYFIYFVECIYFRCKSLTFATVTRYQAKHFPFI